jgi:hypothetical protein
VNTQEEKVVEARRHNFQNVSVLHEVQTEEWRMEIVKVK